jgi:hypothetical protein
MPREYDKEAFREGFKGADIARYYKLNKSTIYRVKSNVTWRDVV